MMISNTKKREGMILLVVVAFLAMFTVMGLTYLLHADAQLKNSIDELLALDMKEDPYKIIDLDPSLVLDFFLEKFLYDQADGTTGGNAIRGQSLARNIYGGYVLGGLNDKAFSGIGKLNKDFIIAGATIKEWQMVNYSFIGSINPERLNDGGSGVKTSTWNAPYTYPDHNNFYLGWLKSDGTKVMPSFHRDYIFGSMAAPFTTNSNWTNAFGKYLTPRPRPFDNLTAADAASVLGNVVAANNLINQRISEGKLFPYPDADGMDVKNLEGYPGGNDSIWIDVGSPVYTALDGRKYKIMVAPLVLDLDGRINVNVAGNAMGTANAHASNQGWGPWEINLSTALGGNAGAITEAQQINLGYSSGGALLLPGVYGTSGIPGGTTLPTVNPISPWGSTAPTPHPYLAPTYSMIDFNAKSEIGANAPIALSNSFASFPTYSGNYTSDVVNNEIKVDGSHPSFVNPQKTKTGNSKFTNNEMASLIRWSGQGSAPKATNLVNLLKNTLGADYIYDNSTMAIRNRITTLSADIQQPTLLPYSYTAAGGASPYISNFGYPTYPLSDTSTSPKSLPYPLGTPLAFADTGLAIIAGSKSDFPNAGNKISGISPIVGLMKQINLNRNLTNYPPANLVSANFKAESELIPPNPTSGGRYINSSTLNAANRERQDFAEEIFNGLKLATGVEASDIEANRYLAQLAVNMVDYIDNDDVMTKFIWKYDPAQSVNTVGGVTYYPCKYEPTYWEDNNGNILMAGAVPVPRNANLDERVFGLELNRVVINEVYSEIRNDPSDTFPPKLDPVLNKNRNPASKPFKCNFWVELVNPLPQDAANANSALLEQDPYDNGTGIVRAPVYKIQILDQTTTGKDPALTAFNNVKGDPSLPDKINFKGFKPDASMDDVDPTKCKYDKTAFTTIDNYEKKVGRMLLPIGANYTGSEPNLGADGLSGFLTIGPVVEFPSSDPTKATAPAPYSKFQYITNIRTNDLQYDIPVADPDFAANVINGKIAAKKHTIVLRRLANPYMKPQEDKTLGDYNPYVTVDFVENVPINDAVTNSNEDERGKNATPGGPSTVGTFSDRKSYNKVQPYRSSTAMVPSALAVPLVDQPQHTFLRHNGSTVAPPAIVAPGGASTDTMLQLPFKWLMHLDRKLINSLEILNVSGCKPQEVTQRFSNVNYLDSNNNKIENKAPWLDEASNLYRFLALADVQGWQQGTAFAGRQIGKVNINNIWDKEVFSALCDANSNNNFTQSEVETVFNNFLTGRSPSNFPTFGDSPIWGFGVGKSAGSDDWTSAPRGIDNSLLRGAGTGNGLFDLPAANGVLVRDSNQRKELLSKIANNITTKSNVFGVWITTGYFEVTNESTDPPTLGAEIGKIAGRNIRHRMFAIVDRTNMVNSQLKDVAYSVPAAPMQNVDFGLPGALILKSVIPPYANVPATAGMLLTFEPNTDNEETVSVRLYNNPANPADPLNGHLVGDFQKTHNPGGGGTINIINRGNPGPWVGYDRTKDREVVPYAEIIE